MDIHEKVLDRSLDPFMGFNGTKIHALGSTSLYTCFKEPSKWVVLKIEDVFMDIKSPYHVFSEGHPSMLSVLLSQLSIKRLMQLLFDLHQKGLRSNFRTSHQWLKISQKPKC